MKSSLCIRRAALGGQNILVKYKDGERVVVPEGTPIVTFGARDKSELKPGADIIIFGVVKKDDGTLEAALVNVGRKRNHAADVTRSVIPG
jgi:hypothetical protein